MEPTVKPNKITDLIDNIDLYLKEMREKHDKVEIPKWLNQYAWNFFRDTNPDKEKLKSLAIFLADHIYRYAAHVPLIDDYTKIYFATVFTELWDTIQSRGVDTFYILDNTLREDRFNLTIQLFALTGVAIVAPYFILGKYLKYMTTEEQAKWVLSFHNEAFDPKKYSMTIDSSDYLREMEVLDLIKKYMEKTRNIIYIEKDSSVNYLDKVIDIAKNSKYTSVLRNQAPDDPNVISIN